MVQKLSDYVLQLQRQGYSDGVIRSQLARSGYSSAAINSAFSGNVFSKNKGLFLFFTSLLMIFVLLLVVYFAFFYSVLEVSLQSRILSSPNLLHDDVLIIEKVITASEDKTSVSVLYELVSSSGQVVFKKSEKLLISGASKSQSRIILPKDVSVGLYNLRLTVYYLGGSVSENVPFNVVSGTPQDISLVETQDVSTIIANTSVDCKEPCFSVDPCVRSSCISGFCKFDAISPCCGNDKCELGESAVCGADCAVERPPAEGVFTSAQSIAKSDPSKALLLCNSLIEDSPVDECIVLISKDANSISLCSSVRSDKARDDCYMRFALINNFSGCDKISDRYMANSCVYLSQAQAVSD